MVHSGGWIPGIAGQSAFELSGPSPSVIPVLIAVPHAGRAYPRHLTEQMRDPAYAAPRLEDRYVDRVALRVAKATGAQLLIAQAPRAMIDLNRAGDDIDWEMIAGGAAVSGSQIPPSAAPLGHRARSGLGLIPRRLPGFGELWKRQMTADDLAERIKHIHAPYHAALGSAFARLRKRWGAALLIDFHSMPPLTVRGARAQPEFVIGDRFGASCHGSIVGSSFAYFAGAERYAAHNRPYSGGYVLDRHGVPERGLHALQLEIDRTSYLDSGFAESGPGLADLAVLLSGLVRKLGNEVAALGRGDATARWAEAAE